MSTNKVYRHTPSTRKRVTSAKTAKVSSRRKKPRGLLPKAIIGTGLTILSLMSAVGGAMLAFSLSNQEILNAEQLTPEEAEVFDQDAIARKRNIIVPELSRPVNILVLGIKVLTSDLSGAEAAKTEDLGYHALVNSFEGLSDTMLLIRLDPATEKVSVLSIPRDTKVNLAGYGNRKINHTNKYGGPALTASTVSDLLGGVEIDRYVRVNVQGVEKLIDALGGVNVFVPKDMKYNDFSQHLYIDLKKGQQHLDGEKAVQFLRFRYDGLGDISRVQRQQMLMRSLVEQSLKPGTIIKVPKILDVIKSHLDTNLTVKELMAISGFAAQAERSDVQMIMLPGDFNNPEERVSYWLPHKRQIRNIALQHFGAENADVLASNQSSYGQSSSEARVNQLGRNRDFTRTRIAIQNSLEDPSAARKMLTKLQEAGYYRSYISNNWSQPLTKTRIVAQKGDTLAAEVLQATLGLGEVLVESTGSIQSDVTIQVGSDWQDYLNIDEFELD